MLAFAGPRGPSSAAVSSPPFSANSDSRPPRRAERNGVGEFRTCVASAAVTGLLARRRTKPRRKVVCFGSQGDGDEVGGPVALVLRSKLQELAKTSSAQRAAQRWQDLGNAKLLMPENTIPWGVTHFIGGAVMGQFPELCYSSLLQPFVDKTGMAVICTPYQLSRDHQELADTAAADLAEAMELGQERFGWAKERMPRLAMGHSLGAKIQVLLCCQKPDPMLSGVALLAFNNFGVEDQVALLREFLKTIQGNGGGLGGLGGDQLWETFLEPAIGRAAKLSGIQFTPGPDEVLDMVEDSYKPELRTRLFRFTDDSLDCSEELLASFMLRRARSCDRLEMKGSHLTPVALSLADMAPAGAGGEVADRLKERFSGFAPKWGSEAELEDLVQALMDFVSSLR